jgi:DNA replication protein
MQTFEGFSDSESFTEIPDGFFQKILPVIADAAELKVTLFFLWQVQHMEGPFRALCQTDFNPETLGLSAAELASGLELAVGRGSLLKSTPGGPGGEPGREAQVFYFLNSPRGRAAADAFAQGDWRESARILSGPVELRPNLFQLYEQNIGPLTPLIADALKDAEDSYPQGWVSDAIALAVKHNKRSWKYAEAILKRWKEDGRGEKQDRRDSEKDRRKYIEGEFSDFIEH